MYLGDNFLNSLCRALNVIGFMVGLNLNRIRSSGFPDKFTSEHFRYSFVPCSCTSHLNWLR